mmetsp:Transcript_31838/g.74391  ORF Transcript_31838/g.74391 Transcript_31838/m.74391 type:complete len:915 (-) Transcript_31838:94-2838(-)
MGDFHVLVQLLTVEYERVVAECATLRCGSKAAAISFESPRAADPAAAPSERPYPASEGLREGLTPMSRALRHSATISSTMRTTGSGVRSASSAGQHITSVSGSVDRAYRSSSASARERRGDLDEVDAFQTTHAISEGNVVFTCMSEDAMTLVNDEVDSTVKLDRASDGTFFYGGTMSNHRSTSARSSDADLWDVWKDVEDVTTDSLWVVDHQPNVANPEPLAMASLRRVTTNTLRAGDVMHAQTCLQGFIMRPSCRKRTLWDILGLIVLLYDMCVIPLRAFKLGALETIFVTTDRITTCFWTVDIIQNFFVGFHSKSVIEMRPAKIARRYLRGWFPIDLLIVVLDWSVIVFQAGSSGIGVLRILKAGRLIRVARCLRVIRVARLAKVFSNFSKFLFITETSRIALEIFLMLAFIALVSHFVACGWYAVGTFSIQEHNSSHTWVGAARQLHIINTGSEPDTGYYYATSLHWALTQFTPASMEVVAVSTMERVYTIMVLLFGLITFSVLVSSITASMTRLRSIHADEVRKVKDVQRYIRENHVSLELGALIFNFVREQRKQRRRRLHEEDVDYLAQLPEIRKRELHVEVFAGTLLRHALFSRAESQDQLWIVEVCHTAFTEQHIPQDQRLFTQDDEGKCMWHLSFGRLSYYGRQSLAACRQVLEPRAFVAEVVLWSPWRFWGRMIASEATDVLCLNVKAFHRTAKQTTLMPQLQAYARSYIHHILPLDKGLQECGTNMDEAKALVREAFAGFDFSSVPLQPHAQLVNNQKSFGSRLLRALSKVTDASGKRRRKTFETVTSWARPSTSSQESGTQITMSPHTSAAAGGIMSPRASGGTAGVLTPGGARAGSRRSPSLQILFSDDFSTLDAEAASPTPLGVDPPSVLPPHEASVQREDDADEGREKPDLPEPMYLISC